MFFSQVIRARTLVSILPKINAFERCDQDLPQISKMERFASIVKGFYYCVNYCYKVLNLRYLWSSGHASALACLFMYLFCFIHNKIAKL